MEQLDAQKALQYRSEGEELLARVKNNEKPTQERVLAGAHLIIDTLRSGGLNFRERVPVNPGATDGQVPLKNIEQ